MSNKPIILTYTDRIDYNGITKRFEALKERAQNTTTIREFAGLVSQPFADTVDEYRHLVSDENYREGELATMFSHCIDCINAIMPEHFSRVCVMSFSGKELLFLPKDIAQKADSPSRPN